jgi:hypothetical protein
MVSSLVASEASGALAPQAARSIAKAATKLTTAKIRLLYISSPYIIDSEQVVI